MLKTCKSCNEKLDISKFGVNNSKKDNLAVYCLSCCREAYTKRRIEAQTFILDYLANNPCVQCGESDIRVLEFNHLRDKSFNIARRASKGATKKLLIKEIEKCEVLCANCHRKHTCNQSNSMRVSYMKERGLL